MVVAVLLPQVQGMAVKRLDGLRELYPRLLSRSALRLGAREVMNFLWCKLGGNIRAEVVVEPRVPPRWWLEDQVPGQAELVEDV